MKVVPLHPALPCADLVAALRNIADEIESGNYDFAPDIAVVVLAAESQRRDAEGIVSTYDWQTHGLGEKASVFATRGVLASALSSFDGNGG